MFTLPRFVLPALVVTAAGLPAPPPPAFVVRPDARVETEPSRTDGDSYDDPAIWLHPTDPAKSLILGTNKQGGLHVFDMDGRQLGVANPDCHPDNVDVLYGFPLDGKPVDLAVAGCRAADRPCARVWRIDPDRRELVELTGKDGIKVFGGKEPYGSCTYRSPKSGKFYFFVNHKSGDYEQYELTAPGGRLAATRSARSSSTPWPRGAWRTRRRGRCTPRRRPRGCGGSGPSPTPRARRNSSRRSGRTG